MPRHTHTHTRLTDLFPGLPRVGRYQKGKTNLDFTEARDNKWQWHQLGICKSAPRSRWITTPAPHRSLFYRPDALPAAQPTASKHWRQYHAKTLAGKNISEVTCFMLSGTWNWTGSLCTVALYAEPVWAADGGAVGADICRVWISDDGHRRWAGRGTLHTRALLARPLPVNRLTSFSVTLIAAVTCMPFIYVSKITYCCWLSY